MSRPPRGANQAPSPAAPAGTGPAETVPTSAGIRTFLANLGPGIVMAATAIGASHVILSPVAGARFGYELLWLVLFAHFFKYPAFQFGARFAIATGTSLIRGYHDVPGPRNWALFVFLATTTLQGLTILSGVLSVTASVLVVTLGGLSLAGWIVVVGTTIIALHLTGSYDALQWISKALMGVLVLVTVFAFFVAPPTPAEASRLFVPSFPIGASMLIASILGLMPTGVNVSIWHSLWAVEHLKIWRKRARDPAHMLSMGMVDLRIGYWLSAGLAIMFMSLGAELLRPRGLTPDGIDVAVTLSSMYTELLGSWMYPVFMVAFFAAVFSTSYSVMDGFPRAFSAILRTLFPDNAFLRRSGDPSYWMFMAVIFGFALLVNTLLPNPVLLVTLVGLVSLMIAPVLYSLNYYCATRLIEDESLRPGRPYRAWAGAGIAFMLGAALFYIYTALGLDLLG